MIAWGMHAAAASPQQRLGTACRVSKQCNVDNRLKPQQPRRQLLPVSSRSWATKLIPSLPHAPHLACPQQLQLVQDMAVLLKALCKCACLPAILPAPLPSASAFACASAPVSVCSRPAIIRPTSLCP
jgi:hypothetical protein